MHTFSKTVLSCAVVALALTILAGCNHDRYYDEGTGPAMAPTEPPKPYPMMEDKEKGVSYAVLQQGSVITKEMDGWQALSPEWFTKLSGGIMVKAPEPDMTPHPGMGVSIPKIEASEKFPERKMAFISGGYIVPKELNGWVAIDHATFEKLAQKFMTSK